MKIRRNVATGMKTIVRPVAGVLCLAWLSTAATACGPADELELYGEPAEVEGDDGTVVVDEEENLGTSAEALGTVGFSTFVGGTEVEVGVKTAVTPAGYVYVAGTTAVAGKGYDIFVAKYSPSGSRLFYKMIGGKNDEHLEDIAVDAAGNSYLLARTASYGPTQTILVAKLNAAGSALLYYSAFGGSGDANNNKDGPSAIAVDGYGNAYVTGTAVSTDFPVSSGAYQKVLGGTGDAFVTKLNASGSAILYSTYLGGGDFDSAIDIAVDSYGYAYVVGMIFPGSGVAFPTTTGAFRQTPAGDYDAFVTQLTPNGSSLYYSTYVGGTSSDVPTGIAVDASFNAYVTGETLSYDFPTTPGAFRTSKSTSSDSFVFKLNDIGSNLSYSTFVRSGGGFPTSIAVSSSGKAYVAGETWLTDFATTSNAFQKTFGGAGVDGFLMELNPWGTAALYATYLGGSANEHARGVAVDGYGNVYVAGDTPSSNFPVYAAAQPVHGGGVWDGFLVKIKP